MATTSTSTLKITRNQLAKFCGDDETIRQFEKLFGLVSSLDSSSGGSSDPVATTFETINKNLNSYPKIFGYSLGKLVSILYTVGSGSITKTLGYAGDKLETVTLSGDTPLGINLTKTLFYSGDDLAAVTYS